MRQHGISKRRTWRKLNLAVDESSNELLAAVLSTNGFKDNEVLDDLLEPIEGPIDQLSADGAYDDSKLYERLKELGIKATIPTRRVT